MKKILLLFLISFCANIFGQKTLIGQVVSEKNEFLEGASVYLNNTMVGTITDTEGKFELEIKEGKFELIISYLGFEILQYNIDTTNFKPNLLFKLKPKANVLDEVVINGNKNNFRNSKNKKFDFIRFRNNFIGKSNFAKNCKIENPEVLNYFFDEQTNGLKVEAEEPIVIYNKDLGFRLYYDLTLFTITNNRVRYLGFTRYEKLKGRKGQEKRWKKNRLKSYNGSLMHFYRSILMANTKEEGFILDAVKRSINKDYPSEEELNFSRKIFREYMKKRQAIPFTKKIDTPKTDLDKALLINRRGRNGKVKDSIYKRNILYSNISFKIEGKTYLKFKDILRVTYTKEKEEYRYRRGKERLNKQISYLHMLAPSAQILKTGQLLKPLDVLTEKYWSYEKVANLLPLDYQPPKN